MLWRRLSILVLTVAAWGMISPAARAENININPTADFGYVVVNAPDADFARFNVSLYKQNDTSYQAQVTQTGQKLRVYAGKTCLRISGNGLQYIRCNYQLAKDQTIAIDLAKVGIHWDGTPAKVDIGQRLHLGVSGSNVNTATDETYQITDVKLEDAAQLNHLLPTGNYAAFYTGVDIMSGESKPFSVTSTSPVDVDVTPDDKRATISVTLPKPKFAGPATSDPGDYSTNTIMLLTRQGSPEGYRKSNNPYTIAKTDVGQGDGAQQIDLSGRSGPLQFLAYPYKQGDTTHYEIVANEIEYPISVTSLQTSTVSLSSLDIEPFNGNIDGFYKVWAQSPISGLSADWIPLSWVTGNSYYRERMAESNGVGSDPKTGKPLTGTLFPTSSSLIVVPGWKYLIRTYAYDQLGELQEQSDFTADLTVPN